MKEPTWLDRLIWGFQHRWETSAQYRAAMSGVVGLVLVVVLCAGTGVVAMGANAALASIGIGATSASGASAGLQGSLNTGTKKSTGYDSIPTSTVFLGTPMPTPVASPLASSQTPIPTATAQPTPTDAPTATPCKSNCGGGGGGPIGTVYGSASPTPWVPGQTGTITIHTSSPNINLYIVINIPGLLTDLQYGTTDGTGTFVLQYPINSAASAGTASISLKANYPGGYAYGTINQQVA